MFNHRHYVPILRWKAAEKGALWKLKSEDKSIITPLVEFVMPQPDDDKGNKTPKELLQESIDIFQDKVPDIADQILKYWGHDSIFIDAQLIDGSIRADILEKILGYCERLDLFMIPVITVIPVVGFESDIKTRQVAIDFAKRSSHGLCLRITESNFNEKSLSSDLENFISKNKLDIKNIDLLVDFKIVNEQASYKFFIDKIDTIPCIDQWRT
ncbi:MAG: hypothetical protein PHV07_09925, partial [Oscillospiraceae bacterium]|nr:hypothetical protein [Oscillospiraceae bacterium]